MSNSHPSHSFRVQVTLSPGAPVILDDEHLALQFAMVDRQAISKLGPEWAATGVYILLKHIPSESSEGKPAVTWELYVGQARKLTERLRNHVNSDKTWESAVLVRRTTQMGFNISHINWMESSLCALFAGMRFIKLINKTAPSGDDAINPTEVRIVEETIERIQMVLAIRGVSQPFAQQTNSRMLTKSDASTTNPKAANQTERSGPRRTAVKVLIENNLLAAGYSLRISPATVSKVDAAAIEAWIKEDPKRGIASWVPSSPDKPVVWEEDGQPYSPSGLATEITKRVTGKTFALQGTAWLITAEGQSLADLSNSLL